MQGTDAVVGLTWEYVAKLRVLPWFDRVDTKSNPVDGLSRGRLAGPWQIIDLRVPMRDLDRVLRRAKNIRHPS